MRRASMRAVTWAAVSLALAVLAAGCSGGEGGGPSPSVTVTTLEPSGEPAVETKLDAGELSGYLPESRQERVVAEVGQVVDAWIEKAWVAGEWPREVSGVWDAFTPEAAAAAEKDARVTSGAGYGPAVSAVRVARRNLKVDLMAQRGTAHGATVRIALSLDVTPLDEPDRTRKVALRGRVFLTPTDQGWKIFGHELNRGGF